MIIDSIPEHQISLKIEVVNFYNKSYILINSNPANLKDIKKTVDKLKSVYEDIKTQNSKKEKSKKKEFKYFNIHLNVVYFNYEDKNQIAWIKEPSIETLIFDEKDGIKGEYEVYIPKMLFIVRNQTYEVYFMRGDSLYLAPFYNNYDNVCIGAQDKVDISSFENLDLLINHYEKVFFNSPFTHPGDINSRVKISTQKYWEEIISGKRKISFKDLKKVYGHYKNALRPY